MSGDSQKLLELAERCEKAEGPIRELDVAIAQAVWPQLTHYAPHCRGEEPIFWDDPFRKQPCPHFTASLDAALTLVPEGFRWKLGYSRYVPCVAELVDYRAQMEPNLGTFVSECDSSHALALCAAALRARAAI